MNHYFTSLMTLLSIMTMSQLVWANQRSYFEQESIDQHHQDAMLVTTLDQQWLINQDEIGILRSEIESYIGTSQQAIYLKIEAEKLESEPAEWEAYVLYSHRLSQMAWAQIGLRYRDTRVEYLEGKNQALHHVDAVIGFQELYTPYFDAHSYLFIGRDQYLMSRLELEKEFQLTDQVKLTPYAEWAMVWNDQSNYAQKKA